MHLLALEGGRDEPEARLGMARSRATAQPPLALAAPSRQAALASHHHLHWWDACPQGQSAVRPSRSRFARLIGPRHHGHCETRMQMTAGGTEVACDSESTGGGRIITRMAAAHSWRQHVSEPGPPPSPAR